MKTLKISSLALAVALTACGGGGSSSGGSSAPAGPSTKSETGVFTDSAVAGINYQTNPGGLSGKTNALGEYNYVEGDTVIFSIGDTELPAVTASGRVTPADMAEGNDADVVTNVLRLLQTLDDDGNPDNGITISQQTLDSFVGKDVEVNQPAAAFESEAEAAIGETLVTEGEAEAHFAASQQADLRGSWLFEDDYGRNVLSFLDYDRYIIAHSNADDGDQEAATAEWGTYTWDPVSGDLTLTVSGESDNSGGLSDLSDETVKLELVDNQFVLSVGELSDDQYEADDTITFTAIKNAANPLVGAWYLAEEGGAFNVLTILDDSNYTIAHNANEESYEGASPIEVSSEWGTYSTSGGAFTISSVEAETDGPGGLYDADSPNALESYEQQPWGDLAFTHADDGSFSFSRIGRFAVELEDLAGNASTVIVEREEEGFFEGMNIDFSIDLVGEDDKANISLNEDGTGTMTFSPGSGAGESSTIDAPWKATTSGTLVFTETMSDESTGSWTLAPIKSSNSDAVIVDFRHVDGGSESLLGFFVSDVANPVGEGEVLPQ
ncbi:MAG: adhesin [Pseudomonadota bacterium]|uniref:adhesin n=1 Tax=Alcanivorax sp. DSM 26293 TaxID=1798238 RepID=UPI0008A092FB|nr:adhesin [Alcanivorax sp. DSM 26293]MED5238555.1 adhesin [Pseudomonadota bacterium]MEE3387935.1 adhesin [Pseudomonadota bacterium]SEG11475.1 hypothetical protein SAMN04515663_107184 [Alcanivorax sp. DSM 26293]